MNGTHDQRKCSVAEDVGWQTTVVAKQRQNGAIDFFRRRYFHAFHGLDQIK
jgi:hypothetical protein